LLTVTDIQYWADWGTVNLRLTTPIRTASWAYEPRETEAAVKQWCIFLSVKPRILLLKLFTDLQLQIQCKRAHPSDTALLLFCCAVRLGATEWQVYGMKFYVQMQTNRIYYERAVRFKNLILLEADTFRTCQNFCFHVQSKWQHRKAVYMSLCDRLHETHADN
jgi:hypothetical protein